MRRIVLLIIGLAVVAAVAVQLVRPVPDPKVRLLVAASYTFPGTAPVLPFPETGEAAVDVGGLGSLGTSGAQTPTPTASVAKVMTAYLFLRDHPLSAGADGPTFTVSPEEAARLDWRKERDESLIDVKPNEPFTVRKALQALMTVSANNIAHEIARWDSGDEAAFLAKMNGAARDLGMTTTTYTDPSGYDPSTVSTAADQVKLLKAAFALPEFEQIVSLRSYTDVSGEPKSAGNQLLGEDGVIGGKTGYTSVAGANFVFASRETEGTSSTLIIGAVMHQPSGLGAAPALEAARLLIRSARTAITGYRLAAKGDPVGWLDDGLGGLTRLLPPADVTVLGWPGLTVPIRIALSGPATATLDTGGGPVVLSPERTPEDPSVLDRLTRLG
ncbi:D-alanyl-D-alanine carboxypeptidase [Actinocorallia longicatena]|uniref:Peptidase S11 D-alanyl-D-alanine carboxypeptidase A N-terminal domain-containing protein n=1 Tax=Actinocorallia longicatena TaxID=111803 RepID=A0ABP6Q9H7_9ACTN